MKKLQSSDYFSKLEKFLGIDEKGKITVKPVYEYNLGNDYKLQVLFEEQDFVSGPNTFTGIGYIVYDDNSIVSCIFNCQIENGNIVEDTFGAIDCNGNDYELTQDGLNFTNISEKLNMKQTQLYTHTLTLTADKSYTLIYQSSSQFAVDSIAALRSMLNVTATNDNVILPVCATDLTATAVLQVTTALCKIGTANVTAVSDKVTTL